MDYTLSSNPPNPKASFRLGDWICPLQKCAAHNFGRNLSCIGCGCPRNTYPTPPTSSPRMNSHVFYSSAQPQWNASLAANSTPFPTTTTTANSRPPLDLTQLAGLSLGPKPPAPSKPTQQLLTPSGRAFAVGGRVQNVSSDPLGPCIMYWPDNEPFPEQGQIRPSNVVGVAPPILNTGNRGPISHQPGDWICQKCNYLNWRRRKVCQTCLPYAEGNGDSISAAVQAERIALLTQVLSQSSAPTMIQPQPQHTHQLQLQQQPQATPRSHSMTPPQVRSRVPHLSAGDLPPSGPSASSHAAQDLIGGLGNNNGFNAVFAGRTVQRSRSQLSLGSQPQLQQHHAHAVSSSTHPIYQTGVRPARATTVSVGQLQHQHQLQQQQQQYQQQQQQQRHHLQLPRAPQRSPLYSTGPLPGAYTYRASPSPSASSVTTPGRTTASTPHNSNAPQEYYNSNTISVHAPAPLLPSFLQDMVQSPPSLSPASNASSSSLSLDEEDLATLPAARRPRVSSGSTDSSGSAGSGGLGSIWRMDGKETQGLVPLYSTGGGMKDMPSPIGFGVIGMGRLK